MNDRRRPGTSAPRAATPAVVVGVTLVAAILGFLILRQFKQDDKSASGSGSPTATNPADPSGTGATAETTPDGSPVVVPVDPVTTPLAVAAPDKANYTVLVANASKIKGTAKALTEALQKANFTTTPPTNAVAGETLTLPIAITRIMYSPGLGFDAAAADVAEFLGVGTPEVMPVSGPPIEPGSTANIVILLGTDLAGKNPAGAVAATSTATLAPAPASPNTSAP